MTRIGVALSALFLAVACANAAPVASPVSVSPPGSTSDAPTSGATNAAVLATPTTSAEPTNAAYAVCQANVDNIQLVHVASGTPTVAAAYRVTGNQMTDYFEATFNHGTMSNGADWWNSATAIVEMCVYDGDFYAMTPGPSGHDTNATRILVVVDDSGAFPWGFCFSNMTSCAIGIGDPAKIVTQSPSPPSSTLFPSGSEAPSPASIVISCQPYGYSPAPASLSLFPGPKSQTEAELIATDFYRTCQDPEKTIDALSTSATWEIGSPTGPNAGKRVWDVKVDAQISEPSGASYGSHFWIEVNAATGIPTLIAYG